MIAVGRRRVRGTSAVLGLTLLVAGLTPGVARAAGTVAEGSTAAALACSVNLGSLTGDQHILREVRATKPVTVTETRSTTGVYPVGGRPALQSYFTYEPGVANDGYSAGLAVQQGVMYEIAYSTASTDGPAVPPRQRKRIGGGWDGFRLLEQVQWQSPNFTMPLRRSVYAVHDDGVLHRWTIDPAGVWRKAESAPGFASLKSIAMISKNYSFDTFLANTRGGALYTIRIPTTAALKPVVTMVRSKTWQGFESLVAQSCSLGEVVVAIDGDTESAYLYAIGHANGAKTPIELRGQLPGGYADPLWFRWGTAPENEIFRGDN
ncbi:hypothetical protein [Kribbella sp. CA-293567]|uniref:hypothetical protein n=1 Tax=Kribbella sp. CA-293567 TaxID=3002436 RepID=UPI0022DD3241|nr:hypothetical protein [Kribbella sp. CA-293567]WBQ02065.1 hypothetical protein OX958_18930 [Kribbella sp. CA-293567]